MMKEEKKGKKKERRKKKKRKKKEEEERVSWHIQLFSMTSKKKKERKKKERKKGRRRGSKWRKAEREPVSCLLMKRLLANCLTAEKYDKRNDIGAGPVLVFAHCLSSTPVYCLCAPTRLSACAAYSAAPTSNFYSRHVCEIGGAVTSARKKSILNDSYVIRYSWAFRRRTRTRISPGMTKERKADVLVMRMRGTGSADIDRYGVIRQCVAVIKLSPPSSHLQHSVRFSLPIHR